MRECSGTLADWNSSILSYVRTYPLVQSEAILGFKPQTGNPNSRFRDSQPHKTERKSTNTLRSWESRIPRFHKKQPKKFLYSSRRFLQLQLLRKRLLVGSHVSNLFDCAQVGVGPLIAHMITFPPVLRVGGGRRQRPPLAQHAWCISHRSKQGVFLERFPLVQVRGPMCTGIRDSRFRFVVYMYELGMRKYRSGPCVSGREACCPPPGTFSKLNSSGRAHVFTKTFMHRVKMSSFRP